MNSRPKPITKTSLTMRIENGLSSVSANVSSDALSNATPSSRDSGDRHHRQKK